MAKTPEAAIKFMDALVPPATAKRRARGAGHPGADRRSRKAASSSQPWDWEFYSEQVRKAKYDLDEAQVKPYFELNSVLQNGVFYAAHTALRHHLQGAQRHPGLPPRRARLRGVRRRRQAAGAVLLRLLQARQQERRRLDGQLRRASRSCSARCRWSSTSPTSPSPRRASPRCISFDDVTTMFHEFGHALHGMFVEREVPEPVRHQRAARLRRVPLAVQRALGERPDGVRALRQALQDRRAHARRAGREDQEGADLQPGLRR